MEKKANGITTISVTPETLDRLSQNCLKKWTYDDFINEMLDVWETKKKSGVNSGKSPQNNQTS